MVEGSSNLTMTGELIGSPEFLAPERALGRTPGPESDLWSLGVLLYAAVEGNSPFRQNTPLSTLRAVVDEELPPPRRAGPLAPVIAGLLRKDPAERLSARGGRAAAAGGGRGRRGPRPPRRRCPVRTAPPWRPVPHPGRASAAARAHPGAGSGHLGHHGHDRCAAGPRAAGDGRAGRRGCRAAPRGRRPRLGAGQQREPGRPETTTAAARPLRRAVRAPARAVRPPPPAAGRTAATRATQVTVATMATTAAATAVRTRRRRPSRSTPRPCTAVTRAAARRRKRRLRPSARRSPWDVPRRRSTTAGRPEAARAPDSGWKTLRLRAPGARSRSRSATSS